MFRPENYLTLEELFYNNEDLSGYEILQWLRFYLSRPRIEPYEVATIKGLYEGWKQGIFRIEGDGVRLREWEDN